MPEAPLEAYLTTTTDGQSVNVQALCGGRLRMYDPGTSAFATVQLGNGGIPTLQNCFNGSAYVEGIANQSLVNGLPYYVGMMLQGGAPTVNFWQRGFTDLQNRYVFQPGEGIPVYTDLQGNKSTLVGMVLPIGGSIYSVLGGSNARILSSNSPWSNVPVQALPANSGQAGISFTNSAPAEIMPALGIYACSWAWRGATSRWGGRAANGAGTTFSTIFIRPFARGLSSNATHYGPTTIHQTSGNGVNTAVSGNGVSLALDDDAYYFGIEAWTGGGSQVALNIEHTVDGYI
jgi:hypothetical protein